ncbi:MAG: PEP-CTERM sorting domain-containing protein [Bryobacterales bacterium]|nr:PEP-CTERM sorting domain-containing protein [Bryobacterales bacterium]
MKCLGLILLLAFAANAAKLVGNTNAGGVANCNSPGQNCQGTTVGPQFTILDSWIITSVETYQNDGTNHTGAVPGPIGFINVVTGEVFSWSADPSSTDIFWVAFPNSVLQAGAYRVWSSDPASWSYNTGTGFADSDSTQHIGMAVVHGNKAPATIPEPSSLALVGAGAILMLAIRRRRRA